MFEPAWSTRTVDDDPGAPFFNDTRKYVVSSTLETATWNNSTILGPYDPEAIRRLKDETNGIYMSGSGTLVRALIADGLIDELHLFVFPLTRGTGPRLFEDGAPLDEVVVDDHRELPERRALRQLPIRAVDRLATQPASRRPANSAGLDDASRSESASYLTVVAAAPVRMVRKVMPSASAVKPYS